MNTDFMPISPNIVAKTKTEIENGHSRLQLTPNLLEKAGQKQIQMDE